MQAILNKRIAELTDSVETVEVQPTVATTIIISLPQNAAVQRSTSPHDQIRSSTLTRHSPTTHPVLSLSLAGHHSAAQGDARQAGDPDRGVAARQPPPERTAGPLQTGRTRGQGQGMCERMLT